MINSNDGGGNVSVNGGETWTGAGIIRPRSSITSPPRTTFRITCAARSRITPPSASPARRRAAAAAAAAARRSGTSHVFAGRRRKRLHRARSEERRHLLRRQPGRAAHALDRNTGHMRDVQVYPLFFSGMPASALKERWQWTFPIVFNPARSEDSVHVVAASVEDHQRRARAGR